MTLTNWVDPKRCYQLVTGIVGIYFCYLSLGILHEYLYLLSYIDSPNIISTIAPAKSKSSYGLLRLS